MAKLPFTVRSGDQIIEGFIRDTGRDPMMYEDHFRESFEGSMRDDQGGLRTTWFQRAAWNALRLRHGEHRSFDEWVDAIDDDEVELVLGAHQSPVEPDPTGGTPTLSGDASEVSQHDPALIPPDSPDSPTSTPSSSTRSSSRSKKRAPSSSPSGGT